MGKLSVHEIVKLVALYVAYFAEIAAAIVIVIGALQAIWIYLRWVFSIKSHFLELTQSQLKLNRMFFSVMHYPRDLEIFHGTKKNL